MKPKYFRLPWSRMKYSQRALFRLLLSELQDAGECLTDRRAKRLETKLQLREVARAFDYTKI